MMIILRSMIFQIYFYLCSGAILLFYGIYAFFRPDRAIIGYRLWAKWVIWGLKKITHIDIIVRGADYIPQGIGLIACKHQSVLETIVIFALLDKPAVVLKKELTYIPLAGQLIKGAKHIPIDRKAGAKAKLQIIRAAHNRIKEGHQLVIFPEGTRSPINSTPYFKRGIFGMYHSLKMECIPVALNTGLFWPKQGFILQSGTVIFEFLPPIAVGLEQEAFMTELTTKIESATARLIYEGVAEQTALRRGTHPSQKSL